MATRRGRKKNKEGKLGIIGICAVVIVFGLVMYIRTRDAEGQMEELQDKKQQYEQQLKEEQDREEYLEDRKIYVRTKMYVEELAKQLGLVYPDEIIYKPEK